MKDKIEQTILLEDAKIEFLKQMAGQYRLSDIGKAVRILIDYARTNPELQRSIFSEVRCNDCD